jgi:hypothetical protein
MRIRICKSLESEENWATFGLQGFCKLYPLSAGIAGAGFEPATFGL